MKQSFVVLQTCTSATQIVFLPRSVNLSTPSRNEFAGSCFTGKLYFTGKYLSSGFGLARRRA